MESSGIKARRVDIFYIFPAHNLHKIFSSAAILLGLHLGQQDGRAPAVGPALAAVPRVGVQVAHLTT